MKIDIDVIALRQLEDFRDLTVWIAVSVGTAANQIGAALASFDQQLLAAWVVEEAFLRKHANLDINGPCIIALQALNGVKAF